MTSEWINTDNSSISLPMEVSRSRCCSSSGKPGDVLGHCEKCGHIAWIHHDGNETYFTADDGMISTNTQS